MPAVDVGAGSSWFNSAAGSDISYNYSSPYSFNGNINIFDHSGALARSYDAGVHTSGNYSLRWPGDFENGTQVPDGSYTINASLDIDQYKMTGKIIGKNPSSIDAAFLPLGIGVNDSGYLFVGNYAEVSRPKTKITNEDGSFYYVSDKNWSADSIYVFRPDGSFFYSFGKEYEFDDQTLFPLAFAFNASGFIFVADGRIDIFYPDFRYFGHLDNSSVPGTWAPLSVAVNSTGCVYAGNLNNICIFSAAGSYLGSFGSTGSGPGQFNYISSLAVDSSGCVYALDAGNHRVEKFDSSGHFLKEWGHEGKDDGNFDDAYGLAVDRDSHVYVADLVAVPNAFCSCRTQVFDSEGNFQRSWNTSEDYQPMYDIRFIATDPTTGHVLVSDISAGGFGIGVAGLMMNEFAGGFGGGIPEVGRVYVTDDRGNRVKSIMGTGAEHGVLKDLGDVAVNATGFSYVVCKSGSMVQVFDPDGGFSFGWDSRIENPGSIAINSSGYVYVSDGAELTVFDRSGEFIARYALVNPYVNIWLRIINLLVNVQAFGGAGLPDASSSSASKLAIGPDDNVYVVSNLCWDRISVLAPDGTLLEKTAPIYGFNSTLLEENKLNGTLFTKVDTLSAYDTLDLYAGFLHLFGTMAYDSDNVNETGVDPADFPGLDTQGYDGIAVNSSGYIYVAVPSNDTVLVFSPIQLNDSLYFLKQNNPIAVLNGTGSGAGTFRSPTDIAIGSGDCVLILDSGNNRTVVLDRDNSYVTQFGTTGNGDGQFHSPQGLGLHPSGDKVVVADTGNVRTQTFEYFGSYYDQTQVTVDNTPPVITGAPTAVANANGWYNGPVTVHFRASDALSGLQSCTGDQIVSTEGANQSVTGTAVDRAGNSNGTAVSGISIDRTAPVINCSLSADHSGYGGLVSDVKVTLGTSDSLSGIDSVQYSTDGTHWVTYNGPYSGTFTVPYGDHPETLYYRVTDRAANTAGGSAYLNFEHESSHGSIAATPTPAPSMPTITPTPVATPVNGTAPSPSAPGVPVSPTPVGTDMLPGIVFVLVIVALLQSRKK